MSTVVKDLGAATAYGYAVEKGYTGTEAEFAELMASYATVGQTAVDAKDAAVAAKTAAQTAATTATNKASEATTAATTATNKAAEAQADADAAALDASQAMSAASTATTKASEATTAAATATSAATTATTAKDDAVSAKTAAQTAQTGAETAAASVSASAAQIATNAEDISQLKSVLNDSQLIDYVQFNSANDGSYISSYGGVGSSDAFSRTDPFVLKKGCKLIFKCRGYAGSVAVIATLNSNSTYTAFVVDDGSTEVKEYTYTADYDITLVLSYRIASEHEGIIIYEVQTNVNEIKSDIETYGLNYSVDFSKMVSGYVNSIGNLISSDLFVHIPPIMLIAGETITVTARGYLTDVAIISEYEGGNVYNPLVLSVDSTVREYSYTATKNTNIVISFNKNYTHIANASVNVRDAIIGVDSEHDALYYGGLFPRLAVIGDSLSSGELVINGTAEDVYGNSWLSFLARRINASARTHYSIGGLTAKGWIETYMTKMQSDNPFNAYFIALGTNDNYTQEYSLGTINDVAGTNTFVGYYKQIIESVRTKAPNAVIFCVSLYNNGESHHSYSNMISDISDLYNNCFYVDFINNSVIYTSTNRVWSESAHFTTLGYNYVSTVIYKLICKIVDENKEYFKWFGKYNSVGTQFND